MKPIKKIECYTWIGIVFLIATFSLIVFNAWLTRIPPLKSYTVYSYNQSELLYKVTAYCPCSKCCGEYADKITASGYRLREGNKLCAANFDFCTVIRIPGYGIAPVLDRGGAIKENCIDVYFDTHQEALEWGVQYLKVSFIR